jgi:predicted Zn finger-like uncharacterized protein
MGAFTRDQKIMFTVCPGCTRQFQIYAEHLAAASGQVRCGFCHEQFNAMDRLYDEPLSNEKILNSIEIEPELSPEMEVEPQFNLPEVELSASESINEDVLISNEETNAGQELETAINEIGISPIDQENKGSIEREVVEQTTPEPVSKPEIEKRYSFDEAEALLEEETVKRSWIPTFFWTTAVFVGLVAIILQLAWFNRDLLLTKYPELTPYVKQVCIELDCKLIRQRDANAIKLINRDVRLHPNYKDTLLVNASMKNELNVRQPYPKVQLTLFDTSGSLLGHREFVPNDYLDNSIAIDEGMPVDSPVHFVLEVSGPTAGAVSFEFRFL